MIFQRIQVFPNKKTLDFKGGPDDLKDGNTVFRSGDKALYSTARADLKRGIREAKIADKRGSRTT